MKSERIGLWLSLLANFGVLVGLALLVVEIRYNTLATQAALNQENLNFMRETTALLLAGRIGSLPRSSSGETWIPIPSLPMNLGSTIYSLRCGWLGGRPRF